MESHGLKRRSGAPPRAEAAHLRLLVGRALALVRRAVGVNSKMLKKWVFAYVNKAAEGKDTLNWLMDYATPGFFDDSGTYDSSYGNMTKGEMDMFDQTLKYYMRNYSEGAVLDPMHAAMPRLSLTAAVLS